MDTTDIFGLFIELLLYGIDILTKGQYTIHDLTDVDDPIVGTIQKYFNSIGISVHIGEEFIDDDIQLYRDNDQYYCEILPKPNPFLCYPGWYLLNYRLIYNKKCNNKIFSNINHYRALVLTSNKIFIINFFKMYV